jgi:hypothetical protein
MNDGRNPPTASPPFSERFDAVVVSHLQAASRLARWLMRNEQNADDVRAIGARSNSGLFSRVCPDVFSCTCGIGNVCR